MDLTRDTKLKNYNKSNYEIDLFMKELSSALKPKQELEINNTLYNEILKDVELAPKYKNKLQTIINKCLKNMSYEREFYYFDFDTKKQKYFLDYYSDGAKTRLDLTDEGLKEFKKSKITFYEPVDEDKIVESDTLKDWMKCEVDMALVDMNIKNKQ